MGIAHMTTPYEGGRKRGRAMGLAFLFGMIIGAVAALVLPPLLQPHLPAALRGGEQELSGVVIAKGMEGNRLLVTLSSPQGTTLATFTEDVSKIDLLVRPGDSLALRVDDYGPFIENPRIARVVSAGGAPREMPSDTIPMKADST
jgi:hypothetical protein